jgi:hypothetical protein
LIYEPESRYRNTASASVGPKGQFEELALLATGLSGVCVTLTIVDAVVLRPLPYPEEERLVLIGWETPAGKGPIAPHEYLACAQRADAFESLAAVYRQAQSVLLDGEGDSLELARVSAN